MTDLREKIARAINDGLGESWAYSNYRGNEWAHCRAMLDAAADEVLKVMESADTSSDLLAALQGIASWCEAYPETVFPQASADSALAACKAAGIPVDAMHGTWARHLLAGISRDARAAIAAAQLVPNSRSPDVPQTAPDCPKPVVKESLATPQPVEIPIADGGRDRD